MALINIQTNLKDLKYRQFGVEPPIITKDINNPPSRQTSLDMQVGARADDLKRFTKLLKTPGGIKFIANQTALQTLEVSLNNPDRTIGGKLLSGGWNVAKQLASTLAQVPVNGTGTHFVEAFAGKQGYISGIQGHVLSRKGSDIEIKNKFENSEEVPTQRTTNSRILKKYLGTGRTTDGILGIFKRDPGKSFKENLDESIIAQTRTGEFGFDTDKVKASRNIESFYFDSNSQTKIGNYNDTSGLFQKGKVAGGEDAEGKKINFIAADPITARLPVVGPIKSSSLGETTESYFDDIIDFNFKVISPRSKADEAEVTILFFRAYLDNFDDKFSGKWKGTNYIGRGEALYNYEGFDRDINFSFKVAALSELELMPLYEKLNKLAGHLAPTYGTGAYMKGNLVTVTIGDYLKNQPGYISSIGFSWSTDYPFNTRENESTKQLPTILDVSVSFKPIHTFAPAFGENFIMNDETAYRAELDENEQSNDGQTMTSDNGGSSGNGGGLY